MLSYISGLVFCVCFCVIFFIVICIFIVFYFIVVFFFFFFQAEDGIRDLTVTGVQTCALPIFRGQEPFQFVVAALDSSGQPVANLTREDILFSENGVKNEVVKIEPLRIPIRLTIAIDNGPLSRDALSHYRAGLEGLVKALPADVEVTLITTAPQPLPVVRPTTDRVQILKGINGFAPQDEAPRFTDSLVEFSELYQNEFNKTKRFDSIPILVTISTTATEVS